MIYDYATLTGPKSASGSIKNWANSELVDVESVLLEAQATIFSHLRAREMRMTAAIFINAGEMGAPLPENCLVPLSLHLPNGCRITKTITEAELIRMRDRTQDEAARAAVITCPSAWVVFDEHVNVNGRMACPVNLTMFYYGASPYLSTLHPKNFLSTRYPNILRTACLAYVDEFRKDSQGHDTRMARVMSLIRQANVEADESRMGSQDTTYSTYWSGDGYDS